MAAGSPLRRNESDNCTASATAGTGGADEAWVGVEWWQGVSASLEDEHDFLEVQLRRAGRRRRVSNPDMHRRGARGDTSRDPDPWKRAEKVLLRRMGYLVEQQQTLDVFLELCETDASLRASSPPPASFSSPASPTAEGKASKSPSKTERMFGLRQIRRNRTNGGLGDHAAAPGLPGGFLPRDRFQFMLGNVRITTAGSKDLMSDNLKIVGWLQLPGWLLPEERGESGDGDTTKSPPAERKQDPRIPRRGGAGGGGGLVV